MQGCRRTGKPPGYLSKVPRSFPCARHPCPLDPGSEPLRPWLQEFMGNGLAQEVMTDTALNLVSEGNGLKFWLHHDLLGALG